MDVSKRLAAAAGLTMWGGVFFAVFAAVLTGPVLHVAAIHWVAAGAWTVVGVALAALTTYLSAQALRTQPDVMKVQRVSRQILRRRGRLHHRHRDRDRRPQRRRLRDADPGAAVHRPDPEPPADAAVRAGPGPRGVPHRLPVPHVGHQQLRDGQRRPGDHPDHDAGQRPARHDRARPGDGAPRPAGSSSPRR